MGKEKYFFNHLTLTYERAKRPIRKQLGRFVLFLAGVAVFATLVLFVAYSFFDSPKEKILRRELAQMKFQYEVLDDRMDHVVAVMNDLQDRDDNIYRVIFESEPIPSAVRQAGFGGANRYAKLEGYQNSNILIATSEKLDKITSQLVVQSKSFDEVFEMSKNKAKFLSSMPAIQPMSNKDLRRLSSFFGYRMDPFYKVMKHHEGVDFSAPVGTDIYATGDGVVVDINLSKRGYGNNVKIDHGFGYHTFYAHCSKILVKRGQQIKRGQIIAKVGNTGKSTAPHLHYEVHKNNRPIDPINYFFSDITPEEYELMLERSQLPSQTLD
ncbi:MAG: M23 family metallopeptidase [Bacteroidales bacterium]|jgi:murein DD-endopeptidase MepM/ murein hydrolase activator NlpD|nr:M23 family metallopeptidase [Bacteroidales bacterium]NCU34906.1 M23 family metallopeptidase [Candidatus Falkowbacteria bacterium]MDD2632268.1 M23 family metallopeptidase [Bacteroidales bacterium]MDD3130813.1 M23 family metallopeptidase [Bacteroidales bacterium]MDD3525944.1 M23 family metallopeptidase [Bacteroidales bacterium]